MKMDYYREPKNDDSCIFTSNEHAIKWLETQMLLEKQKKCIKCEGRMTMVSSMKFLNKKCFQCNVCKHRISLFSDLKLSNPKIDLNVYFKCIYKWLENMAERDVLRNCQISKKAYQNIKKHLYEYSLQKIENNKCLLGGTGKYVQVDETAIAHGKLPNYPSALSDETSGITWLVGIIEEDSKTFYYEIVENRKQETMQALFKRYIKEETIIVTDGHLSYPGAVRANNCYHQVVNHSRGFKNINGFHTNNIENLWSILKYEINKRRGVKKSALSTFLIEFKFRYENLRKLDTFILQDLFAEIINFLCSEKN